MLRFQTLSTPAEFAPLAEPWDELVRRAARPSPFMLHAWLSCWWRHHGRSRAMQVEVAFDGDRLVGAIPLEIEHRPGLRVARLMGRHHAALGDLLAAPGYEDTAGRALVARLRDTGAHYVDLFGLSADGLLMTRARPPRGTFVRRVEAPFVDVAEGWDVVYRRKTSSKRRNLHNRRRRQLAEYGELRIAVAREPGELASAIEDAFVLHDLRWSGRPDGSEFTTPAGAAFHREAVVELGRLGIARILTLSVGGRPVAFHYYLLLERRMYVHRLAFDPALARLSPGQIATLAAIEAAAAEGIERVEFLGGAERYKVDLADDVAPLYEFVGLPSSLRGLVASQASVRAIEARLRLKESERLHRVYFDHLGSVRRLRDRLRARPSRSDDDDRLR